MSLEFFLSFFFLFGVERKQKLRTNNSLFVFLLSLSLFISFNLKTGPRSL